MNMIKTQCLKCGQDVLASFDEVSLFSGSVCDKCDTKLCKFIRHRAVYGYYDLPSVMNEIVEKILSKELVDFEYKMSDFAKNVKIGESDVTTD